MAFQRSRLLLVATVVAFLAANQSVRAQDAAATDALCPAAMPYVAKYVEQIADANTPIADLVATIDGAISAYDRCAGFQGLGSSTTGRQYAELRSAQFHVVVGRLQRRLGEYDDARSQMLMAIALVKEEIEWRDLPPASPVSMGNGFGWFKNSPVTSRYREIAIAVRDAALAELETLPKQAAEPRPA